MYRTVRLYHSGKQSAKKVSKIKVRLRKLRIVRPEKEPMKSRTGGPKKKNRRICELCLIWVPFSRKLCYNITKEPGSSIPQKELIRWISS